MLAMMLEQAREYWAELHERPWQPVPRLAAFAWTGFYSLFLVHALRSHSGFLWIDNANFVVHEGGHLLFSHLGYMPGIWGGTVLQMLVPLLLAATFYTRREPHGFVFCTFLFFENFLYTATYMADARALSLPLLGIGDDVGHDWNIIFSSLGVLHLDTRVATVMRVIGWCGMLGAAGWMARRGWIASSRGRASAAGG
jgi:hypothetical protein